ncbi:NAD-dependent epimerase/dehydratase family protein [Spirillospora sp. NPDC052242]
MEIVGRGFIARNLRPISGSHDDVVVFAAGVPTTSTTLDDQFRREAVLLYDVVRRCKADGRRLVFFSTCSAAMYGVPDCLRREDAPVFPLSAYGRHNLAMEGVLAAAGIDYLVIRLTHLVGPFQRPHQLFPHLVRGALRGSLTLHRGARRDLLDVVDMVAILDTLLFRGIGRRVVNIASGVPVPIEDIVAHIERRLGRTADKHWIDPPDGNIEEPVDLTRLTSLVPAVAWMGFGPDYYRSVIDRYIGAYTRDALLRAS